MMNVTRLLQLAGLALVVLSFGASEAISVPRNGDSTWLLQKGRGIPSLKARKPTLSMKGEKLSGSTGCNSFTATLAQHPNNRVAIEDVTLTRMLCEPGQNAVEVAFVGALRQTQFMTRQGRTLRFLSGEKAPLLVWKRQGKSSLQGYPARRKAHVVTAPKRHGIRKAAQRAGCSFFR